MINRSMFDLGAAPNKIRELFAYGMERKAEIGAHNVFDYSIGNPSIPAPDEVRQAFLELLEMDPVALHEYTPSPGDPAVRAAIAKNLNDRFDLGATAGNVYVTSGASSAIAISLAAICNEGDEVITISPYFPEYKTWTHTAGAKLIEVAAAEPSFQLDLSAIESAVNEHTSAIIINSPNNPVGSVYPEESLRELAAMLERKQRELGRDIYIISDDAYREIAYGAHIACIPQFYTNTITCYTYSKSFSLPGERIGYIYVNNAIDNCADVFTAVCGAGRALGYICAPVVLQRVIAKCIDVPSDVRAYEENRALLTAGLSELGYEFVEPEGAFYLWVKALEPDAEAFSEKAKEFELLLVPSNSFGSQGWVRLTYCIERDTIERSMPAFKALKEAYSSKA